MLADGSVRIYFFAQEKGILSATSSGDLKTWTIGEPVTNSFWGQPRILKLDDGTLRLYFVTGDVIKSAFSTDGINFSEEEIKQLNYERYHYPHPLVQKRMEALYLKSQKLSHQQICQICQISKPTFIVYLKKYQEGGKEALKKLGYQG